MPCVPAALALRPWLLELLLWVQLPGFPLVNEVIPANDNELKHPCLACSLEGVLFPFAFMSGSELDSSNDRINLP